MKVKLEDVPKCWMEIYLTMPRSTHNNTPTSSKVIDDDTKKKKGTKRRRSKEDEDDEIDDLPVDPKAVRKKQVKKKGSVEDCDDEDDDQILTEENDNILEGSLRISAHNEPNNLKKNSKNAIVDADVCVLDDSVLTEGRYVHLDLFNGGPKTGPVIDKPKLFEMSMRRKKAVSYVVAVDINGLMVDVTNRYVPHHVYVFICIYILWVLINIYRYACVLMDIYK
jgi:hypothetical protein